MTLTQDSFQDYRTSMQEAARAYLLRHQAHYLSDSDRLFESCVRHLIVALEVPTSTATKLVHLAWSEIQDSPQPRATQSTL
ncbi:hypothetical protein [Pseudomonas sp. fls2-241-R2A-110]|uniref:hypothetical protein n=1 Tax=Pseudomonas sp. fls2-241-R2A-110 TaxID=3040311 RepID=UPI00255346E3|nr:hypothetical protein [Pseudomonas sp. fls2-241-R2A-110]